MYQSEVVETRKTDSDISVQPITTYGIMLADGSGLCIRDISTNRSFVEKLRELCCRNQEDPDVIMELVDNFLFDLEL